MTDAVISYTDEDTGTVFRWHGGAYIDVGWYGPDTEATGIDGDGFHAYDVINVWNLGGYDGRPEWSDLELTAHAEAQEKTAPRTFRRVLELFEERCQEYLARSEREERLERIAEVYPEAAEEARNA